MTDTSAGRRPIVGLVVAPGEGERLRALVRYLAGTVDVVAANHPRAGSSHPQCEAMLVSGEAGLALLPDNWAGPTALWRTRGADGPGDELVVGSAEAVRADSEDDLVTIGVSGTLTSLPEWDPMSPLIRERWRTRFDWPSIVVVPAGHGRSTVPTGSPELALVDRPDDDAAAVTLLGLANAAVVDSRDLPTAVALATPCVCINDIADHELAAIVPIITGSINDAIEAASRMAAGTDSPTISARLLDYRNRHAAAATATELTVTLGLSSTVRSFGDVARRHCRTVGMSPDSPLAARLNDHFAPFEQAPEPQENRS